MLYLKKRRLLKMKISEIDKNLAVETKLDLPDVVAEASLVRHHARELGIVRTDGEDGPGKDLRNGVHDSVGACLEQGRGRAHEIGRSDGRDRARAGHLGLDGSEETRSLVKFHCIHTM